MSRRFFIFLIPSLVLAGTGIAYFKSDLGQKHFELVEDSSAIKFNSKVNKLTTKNYKRFFEKFHNQSSSKVSFDYYQEVNYSEPYIRNLLEATKSPKGNKDRGEGNIDGYIRYYRVNLETIRENYDEAYLYFNYIDFNYINKNYYLDQMMTYPYLGALFRDGYEGKQEIIEIKNEEGSKITINTDTSVYKYGFGPFGGGSKFNRFKIEFELCKGTKTNKFSVDCKNKYDRTGKHFKEFYLYKLLDQGKKLRRKYDTEVSVQKPYVIDVTSKGKTYTFDLTTANIDSKIY